MSFHVPQDSHLAQSKWRNQLGLAERNPTLHPLESTMRRTFAILSLSLAFGLTLASDASAGHKKNKGACVSGPAYAAAPACAPSYAPAPSYAHEQSYASAQSYSHEQSYASAQSYSHEQSYAQASYCAPAPECAPVKARGCGMKGKFKMKKHGHKSNCGC